MTAPARRELVEALEKHGHLAIDGAIKSQILGLSAATIDRMLAPTQKVAGPNRSRRRALQPKTKMSVRTFADWSNA